MRERGGAGLGGALGPSPGPRGVRIGGEGGGGGGGRRQEEQDEDEKEDEDVEDEG